MLPEVLDALEEIESFRRRGQVYPDPTLAALAGRPVIIVGSVGSLGRSVSVRGGDRVLTHIIAGLGPSVPSADASQLVMRGSGDTKRFRIRNGFDVNIKLLAQEVDVELIKVLYPVTVKVRREGNWGAQPRIDLSIV